MSYKCRICGVNDVDNQGGVCEMCIMGQDPYVQSVSEQRQSPSQQGANNISSGYIPKRAGKRRVLINGGNAISNTDPFGNNMISNVQDTNANIVSAGQKHPITKCTSNANVSVTNVSNRISNQSLTIGITKNITIDNQKKSILSKWFRALFTGIPFTIDDDITMFQVFPDYTGNSLNAQGNACDQVIVYGKLNNGAVSENNDVEVFGSRDSNNNIIAKTIRNKASGTTVTPLRTISAEIVWLITLFFLLMLAIAVMVLGIGGIIGIIVIILCLTNLPKVLKIVGIIFGVLFSFVKRLFGGR